MSDNVIFMNAPHPLQRYCAFCNKHESQVHMLITGMEGKCICDACVKRATELIKSADSKKGGSE